LNQHLQYFVELPEYLIFVAGNSNYPAAWWIYHFFKILMAPNGGLI